MQKANSKYLYAIEENKDEEKVFKEKILNPDFDPTKPASYIIYLDANNLYGWAMVQAPLVSVFKWLSEEEEIYKHQKSY